MTGHLTDDIVTQHYLGASAAGTTNVVGTGVDLSGYDAFRFIADIGALSATQVTSLLIEYSDDNSTWFTLQAGAAMADADSNKMLIGDVIKPNHRYVRATVKRATANAVINCVLLELYRVRSQKVAQDATVSQATKS